ncbi:uncharacterized protein [Parasteatoda tepidariorum]|uniref:uncharacterized protein n=1 Tax=Parasteatoda tepidariorum TaxID=114398 RepID=UPI0039BD7DE4
MIEESKKAHENVLECDKDQQSEKTDDDEATLGEFDMATNAKFELRDWCEVLKEQMVAEVRVSEKDHQSKTLEKTTPTKKRERKNAVIQGAFDELDTIETLEQMMLWLIQW